jgi:tetratricopeptide (TPR) repeat protein
MIRSHCVRALANVALVALLMSAEIVEAWAQGGDDLAALSEQVVQLSGQAKHADATPIAQRALALAERLYGPDHPETATSLDKLAELYYRQGRAAESEPLFKRALAIREIAGPLKNLAALYLGQGRYAEAEPLLKRALAIRETRLGLDHPAVADSLNDLAELYRGQGRAAEAGLLFERAGDIRNKAK